MIREADLKEDRQGYKFKDPNISLEQIRYAIEEKADEYGLPIGFTMDQIKGGGMLNKTVQDCLVIYHKHHPTDYFRNVITLRKQGNVTFVAFHYYGYSKNTGKEGKTEERSKSLSGQLLNIAVGKNHKAAYAEEYDYYQLLGDVLREAMEGE